MSLFSLTHLFPRSVLNIYIQCSSDISELLIRVSYEHILRIRICQYVHIYAYMRTHIRVYTRVYVSLLHAYMCLCYAFPYVTLCEALLVKQRTLYFLGMKMLQSEICILLKHHADQWKLSYFEYLITSQIHLLKLAWSWATKSGKKIETVAGTPSFNTWTLSLQCLCK